MADTKIRSPRATWQLKADHDQVRELFARFRGLDVDEIGEKQRLFDRIRDEITFHAAIEEELFYPALEGSDDEDAEDLVDEARQEHRIVTELLEEISELLPDDPAFDSKMKVLSENVEQHAAEEEKHLFTLFDRLPEEKQEEISEEIRFRKLDLSDDEREPI